MLHRSEHKYHIYVRSIQNPHCRRPSSTNMDLRYCALPTSFQYYSVCIVFLRPVVFLSLTAIPGTWYVLPLLQVYAYVPCYVRPASTLSISGVFVSVMVVSRTNAQVTVNEQIPKNRFNTSIGYVSTARGIPK